MSYDNKETLRFKFLRFKWGAEEGGGGGGGELDRIFENLPT